MLIVAIVPVMQEHDIPRSNPADDAVRPPPEESRANVSLEWIDQATTSRVALVRGARHRGTLQTDRRSIQQRLAIRLRH